MATLAISLFQLAVIVECALRIAETTEAGSKINQVVAAPIIQFELFIELLGGEKIFQCQCKIALKRIHGATHTAGIRD